MKFTVERKALVKMLQCVGKKAPSQKRRETQVRLSACAARVFVEANQTTAGTEALVFEDGTCFLQQSILLKVLKTYKIKPNVTIEADGRTLRFFSTTLPVTDYSRAVTPPGKFQVFPVTDLSVLRPDAPPAPAPEPDPAPAVSHAPGTFPIAQDEMHLADELVRLTRRLIALPNTQPEHLVGLARALFALQQLPRITPGIEVEFGVGVRSGTEASYTENPVVVQISSTLLSVGTTCITYDSAVGGDHHSTTYYEVESTGWRSMEPGDQDDWMGIHDWIIHFDSILDENRPEDLRLFVSDDSDPACMPQ